MGKDKVAAGVKGKSPKAGMVDPKGAWTKVQERTIGKMKMGGSLKKAATGMAIKPKGKVKPKQTPADFYPASYDKKFPRTPGGGDNYDETIKREKELKAKGMMKAGGKMKKCRYGCK